MSTFGGKQRGAGRPKGSTTKPRISDHLTKKEIEELVKKCKTMALEGNETMLKFILEQHFGKAVQKISGDEDGDPINVKITGMKIVEEK